MICSFIIIIPSLLLFNSRLTKQQVILSLYLPDINYTLLLYTLSILYIVVYTYLNFILTLSLSLLFITVQVYVYYTHLTLIIIVLIDTYLTLTIIPKRQPTL